MFRAVFAHARVHVRVHARGAYTRVLARSRGLDAYLQKTLQRAPSTVYFITRRIKALSRL